MKALLLFCLLCGILSASSEESFEKIFQVHSESLPYLEEPNKPLLVFFSGVPGSGKTTVAKTIEETFHAVRICGDDIRIIIRNLWGGENVDPLLDPYVHWLLRKIERSHPNHFVIIDRGIDRKYDTYLPFIQKSGCPTFLIQMSVSRPLIEERIQQRGLNVAWFLQELDSFWRDYERFNQSHTADYVFDNTDQTETALKGLMDLLKHKKCQR